MFRFNFIMSIFGFVFAIIFCTFLWHLVTYIDNFFIASMYVMPEGSGGSVERAMISIANVISQAPNSNIIIVNMVAGVMFVIVPSIFTGVLAMAGYKVGGVMDAALSKVSASSEKNSNPQEVINLMK